MNLEKHGLDFAEIDNLQWSAALVVAAKPSVTGQPRTRVTGMIDGKLVTFIIATLGHEAIAIISLRPASARERKEFLWSRSTRH